MNRLLFVLIFAWAGSAVAEARVALLPFSGPRGSEVRAQLAERLCQEAQCVKRGKKGSEVQVDGVVQGRVLRQGKRLALELKVYNAGDSKPTVVTMPISRTGKMSPAAVASAVASVHGAVTTDG